jgi:hypothetical protein
MSFSSDLKKAYATKVLGTLEKTVRAVALVVDGELAITTPVDTGRARANWLPSLNSPDTRQVQPGQKPNLEKSISSYKISDKILITNNLPYIRKLNDGSSKQAPAGFVDAAIAKGKRAIKGAAKAKIKGSTR